MRRLRSVLLAGLALASALVLVGRESRAQATEVQKLPADWFWGKPDQRAKQDALVGKKAPHVQLSGWMNGEQKAENLKGKIVVVDFWAAWCGPCIAAIPKTNDLAKKYADQGVVVVGICGSSNGQEKMGQVAAEKGIQYPIARDHTQEAAKAYQVMWWPTYAIIDRNGIVRGVGLKTGSVEDAVKRILQEQPADKTA